MLAAATVRQTLSASRPGVVGATWAFGALLLVVAIGGRALRRAGDANRWPAGQALLAGAGLAVVLLLPGIWLRANGHLAQADLYGAGFFIPFVPALLWVAPAEELFLRGLLQPLLKDVLGGSGAIALGALVFAAIHLPAYGWGAMPLDLGVGLLLGWLRDQTGRVSAPLVAHTLADLGSWFLA